MLLNNFITRFFDYRAPTSPEAHTLYRTIVRHARNPKFYNDMAVPDTKDGRFEMIVLHTILIVHALNRAAPQDNNPTPDLSQALFDTMFMDMDRNLREIGIGDMSVPRHMKRMMGVFYERFEGYTRALTQQSGLENALAEYVFRHEKGAESQEVKALTAYVITQDENLSQKRIENTRASEINFV